MFRYCFGSGDEIEMIGGSYYRGLNNYQSYGSIFLIYFWALVPQMDLKMVLVII